MARSLLIFSLFIFGGEASGIFEILEAQVEESACSSDCDGQCPPGCSCLCCAHSLKPIAPPSDLASMPLALEHRVTPASESNPSPPEPGEIFHVPKQGL
jgi:hypothetical protein